MHIVHVAAANPDQVSRAHSTAWLIFAVLLNVAVVLYVLPTLVALVRHVRNAGTIAVINIFLGWSFYGWVAALALACQHVDKPPRTRLAVPSMVVQWPQAGWYPDPWSGVDTPPGSRLRFFDGCSWTASTASCGSVVAQ
jgi:hypothetical protein